MIYDLSQPVFNNVPQWPKCRPGTMTIPHLAALESENVEWLELMTHTGTHIDAPFHFFSQAETVVQLPLTHFHAPCLTLGFNDLEKETAAHKVLLGARKLIIEDICVPETMLKGSTRHFAAFPVLIQGAGRAWTLAVAWDEGETA
jgi:kynurenine formamidase